MRANLFYKGKNKLYFFAKTNDKVLSLCKVYKEILKILGWIKYACCIPFYLHQNVKEPSGLNKNSARKCRIVK